MRHDLVQVSEEQLGRLEEGILDNLGSGYLYINKPPVPVVFARTAEGIKVWPKTDIALTIEGDEVWWEGPEFNP